MDHAGYFARDYRSARALFRAACEAAGLPVDTYENPAPGPDGAPVYADVTSIGPRSAANVVLATAGTHGVEGFCGSGAMVGWLHTGEARHLPDGVRVVFVHAINPHGFAWLRRVNEDNVDLNRNFIRHDRDRWPANAEYARLHPALVPERWDDETRAACVAACRDYIARHGQFALQSAISRGQYDHADGLFYGGRAPTWSNRTFRAVLERDVAGARRVAYLDFHTGLGPYGTAELISSGVPGTPLGDRLARWFGHGLTAPSLGNSSSPALSGVIRSALDAALPGTEITGVTVEFGTYSVEQMLEAVRADNWLHRHGDLASPLGREIKAFIRQSFYPDEDDWKELVFVRARQVLLRAVRGVAETAS
ncbi:MAG: DUF2817 domain-containing protein [Alphaproteobacteria bacterium]|nr:DUF2817 domain-containing protein [Alphaproteobacteria bacterium]